jgi:hypothetical protein
VRLPLTAGVPAGSAGAPGSGQRHDGGRDREPGRLVPIAGDGSAGAATPASSALGPVLLVDVGLCCCLVGLGRVLMPVDLSHCCSACLVFVVHLALTEWHSIRQAWYWRRHT